MADGQRAVESLVMDPDFWKGKNVALTGHTGFKGSWLCLWLHHMGAKVHGFALEPMTQPSLFLIADVQTSLSSHTIGDIRDLEAVEEFLRASKPDLVIHMAAQSLVRQSYLAPLDTLSINIMGTCNLLDACHRSFAGIPVINVTSDKCYQNDEKGVAFVEEDPMGGNDIYSVSKGAAEIVSRAYAKSFFDKKGIRLANVRAGNVIGGGDWSSDRLLPDFFRAREKEEAVVIRSPDAVRPWQHVLEPLGGYLKLAEHLCEEPDYAKYQGGWNFGPSEGSHKSVQWVIDYMITQMGGDVFYEKSPQPSEAGFLSLNSSKANSALGWRAVWDIESTLNHTVAWETARLNNENMREFSMSQISHYMADM